MNEKPDRPTSRAAYVALFFQETCFGPSSDPGGPFRPKERLEQEDAALFRRVADLLGPIGEPALHKLADRIWETAYEKGRDDESFERTHLSRSEHRRKQSALCRNGSRAYGA